MADRYEIYRRLEPDATSRSLAAGFSAAVHDPAWFLARQWQMGEHQGENATTPVLVTYSASSAPLRPAPDDPTEGDPAVVPAEALIEAEPDGWWTMGRRVRIGAALGLNPADVDPAYLLTDPPPPYEQLAGQVDGWAAWKAPEPLGLSQDDFTEFGIPAARPFRWDPEELVYTAEFLLSTTTLKLPRHRGGAVDWFSAVAPAPAGPGTPVDGQAFPSALQYPGAPNSGWWEIEDAAVDIAGYPPDSSHFATTLLIDLICSHSDDWFLFPIDVAAGSVFDLTSVTVTDSFGVPYDVTRPSDPWWLFKTSGLAPSSLVVWLRALTPIEGPPVEDVLVGLDEYANLLWAVERQVDGRILSAGDTSPAPQELSLGSYVYQPAEGIAAYWHPYEVVDTTHGRRFVQRRLADLSGPEPDLFPAARAEVLRVRSPTGEAVHQIQPATVPSIGVVFDRRHVLARDIAGNPVLWSQRRRSPFLRPPSRAIRFDVFANDKPPA